MLFRNMIRRLISVVMLTLSASPVTAPFQTFYPGNSGTGGNPLTVVHMSPAARSPEINPGSLVPPLRTQPGCLSVAADVGLIVTPSNLFPFVVVTPLVDGQVSPPVFQLPIRQTVLRI